MKNIIVFLFIFVINIFANSRYEMIKKFNEQRAKMTVNYKLKKAVMIADWLENKAIIEQKWGNFKNSSKKEFVNYNKDLDSRSTINFKDGYIEVEAVLENNSEKAKQKAIKKIKKQTQKMIEAKDPDGNILIKDQIKLEKKENKKDEKKVINDLITKKINKAEIIKIPSKQKKEPVKYKIKIKLSLQDKHTLIRAKKYYSLVKKYAKKYNLEPEYILAIIETESYFNPYSKSSVPAYGLMQLVPKSGAYDASKIVYGKYKILTSKTLYNPQENIKLGTAYFNLIFYRYLKNYKKDKLKHLLACTAAYNCGPGRVSRFMKKNNVLNMSNKTFYKQLKKNVPLETKNYIDRVMSRTQKYYQLRM